MAIQVVRPGMLTTVQDAGRWGWQSLGVPVAGPMDWYSYQLANRLVGNPPDAAALEVTAIGPELLFERPARVATSGAGFSIRLGDEALALDVAHEIEAGAGLRFGERRGGARGYLAVAGGIDVPLVLGSRSTHLLSAMGGRDGRALRAGDRLPVGVAPADRVGVPGGRSFPMPAGGARVRILAGPAEDGVETALRRLTGSRYLVGAESDRMGYRLEGPDVCERAGDLISEATVPGAIQIPPSGQPIVLMADRQPTGGYPTVASVITADQPIVGQLLPGDWIEFELCGRRTALEALRARAASLTA